MSVADLNIGTNRPRRLVESDPVNTLRDELDRLELLSLADDDAVFRPLDLDDVQRFFIRDAQAATLIEKFKAITDPVEQTAFWRSLSAEQRTLILNAK